MQAKDHYLKYLIILVGILLVLLPLGIRTHSGNPTIPGTETYYHLTAGTPVSPYQGEHYTWEPYHLLIQLMPPAWIAPLLGILSYLLLALILKHIVKDNITESWILLIYALSPTYVTLGFLGGRALLSLTLLLLGTYLLLHNKTRIIGTALFVIASLSGTTAALASLAALGCIFMLKPELKQWLLASGILSALTLLAPSPPHLQPTAGLQELLSEVGGFYGTSIFNVILVIVAAIILWKNKAKYYTLFAIIFALFTTSIFLPELYSYTNIIGSTLAGYGLAWLSKRKWNLAFLRNASLLVIFCGLLFSSVSHIVQITDTGPTPTLMQAAQHADGTVLTHANYGFWIQYTGTPTVVDPYTHTLPDGQSRMNNIAYAFSTTNLKDLLELLQHYNIENILITQEMQEELIWDKPEQGLDFLVTNAETFKRTYQDDKHTLWSVK